MRSVLMFLLCYLLPASVLACPVPVALTEGEPFAVTDTTVGHPNERQGWGAPGSSSPDVTYGFHVPATGTLRARVTSHGDLEPRLYWRTDCAVDERCAPPYPDHSELAFEVAGPADYYWIVDGAEGTSGAFDLEVEWHATACGDGIVGTGEQCDRGELNGAPASGCTADCEDGSPGAGDTCASAIPVSIPRGFTTLPMRSTIGFGNDYDTTHCSTADGSSGDLVYAFTPARTGTMTVAIGYDEDGEDACYVSFMHPYCWDRILYARRTCGNPATEAACSDEGALDPESITMTVTKSVPIFIFVDGYWNDWWSVGPFTLDVVLL